MASDGVREGDWDVVDQASYESFPASDPPGWAWFAARPSETTCGRQASEAQVRRRPSRATSGGPVAAVVLVALAGLVATLARRRRRGSNRWRF